MEMKKMTTDRQPDRMMRRASRYLLPVGAALLMAGSAAAQTLHESISVEGKYVPDIIRIDRLYLFPEARNFPLESTQMDYTFRGVAASFSPTLMTMPATGWRTSREFDSHRGYVQAGLGSWLNSDLSAGGRFIDNGHSVLGAWLQFNSSSLWKPELTETTADRKRERYDGTVGVYGGHDFGNAGRLDAALNWHTGYFNYYSYLPRYAFGSTDAPTQTLNDMAVRVGWNSRRETERLFWHAEASARYFGYRRLYLPDNLGVIPVKPARETRISVAGGLAYPWESGSSLGFDAVFDGVLYSSQRNVRYNDTRVLTAPESYSQLAVTPFYRFSRGPLNIRVGAELDFTFNAGLDGERYQVFHAAPDVRLDMQKGPVGLYLNVLGGSELQTLATLYDSDYYGMPTLSTTRPVYTPLDASLGLSFGPFSGFSAGIEVAYKVTCRQPLRGWYGAMLRENFLGGWLPAGLEEGSRPLLDFDTEGLSMHGVSLGLNASYTTGRVLTVRASGRYQPQNGKKGYFNGYDRPRWTADINATLNPWNTLKFSVGYSYRGVRNIYTRFVNSGNSVSINGSASENPAVAYRLPDLTLLNAGMSYDFTPSFGLWVEADNLLNRHDARLPGLLEEGVSVTGGFRILF